MWGCGLAGCALVAPDHVAGRHDLERLAARAADHELPLRPHAARSACARPAGGGFLGAGTHRKEEEGVVRELGDQQLRVVLLLLLIVFLVRA